MGMSVSIATASEDEAEQILKLQYLAYQREAELYGDWAIDPLTQTLDSLRQELESRDVLVARLGAEVVASVRGWVDERGVGHIDRLIVHPRMQRHGLGRRLLEALEQRLAAAHHVTGFVLSTGHRSLGSLRLYAREGYRQTGIREVNRMLSVVTLEKSLGALRAA